MILSLTVLLLEYYYGLVFLRSILICHYNIIVLCYKKNKHSSISSLLFLTNGELYVILQYYDLIVYRGKQIRIVLNQIGF